MIDISGIKSFLDDTGRLTQWPAKRAKQNHVLEYLSEKFEYNHTYTEKEVNAILQEWHTFGDWAILRRSLIDNKLLARTRDDSAYHRPLPNESSTASA